MAKNNKTEIQEISPVHNPSLDDREAYPSLNAGEPAEEVKEAAPQPLRRTIVGVSPDSPQEPDTYERPPSQTAPPAAKRDPAIPKSGFVPFTSPSATEAMMSDEKWSLVRPNRTQVCIIGPRRWYFEKDVQISVPDSVKQVLARASLIYPG